MKEKRLDFELLRLIAIFLVVFNHTQYRGFELYQISTVGSVNYIISMILGVICKSAVPLFFLVSGGLLLHRTESLETVLKKRVLRIFCALILFSAILYGFQIHWGYISEPGFLDLLFRIWHSGVNQTYWFLYAYLGLMLMLPLLRPLAQGMSDQMYIYLLILHILYNSVLIPIGFLTGFGSLHTDFVLPLVGRPVFYFLMGYYMTHRFDMGKLCRRHMLLLNLSGAAAVVLTCVLTYHCHSKYGEYSQEQLYCFLWLIVFTVYLDVCVWVREHPILGTKAAVISTLGSCVFGTYLMEAFLRGILDGVFTVLEPAIHVLPACFVWVMAVTLCGLFCTWLLRKIPFAKKLI